MMDAEWLENCRAGDSRAVERLVGAYQPELYRLAYTILNDAHEADDAVQETFLAALRGLDGFRHDASLKTWLYRIAINTCRNRQMRRKSRERLQQVLYGLMGRTIPTHPEATTIQNEQDRQVWRSVQNLDEKHRIPVLLRYYHELSVAEIAELLAIPPGTVHSRLNTAREKLRGVLEEGGLSYE